MDIEFIFDRIKASTEDGNAEVAHLVTEAIISLLETLSGYMEKQVDQAEEQRREVQSPYMAAHYETLARDREQHAALLKILTTEAKKKQEAE